MNNLNLNPNSGGGGVISDHNYGHNQLPTLKVKPTPLHLHGGRKMAITPKNNDSKEPKLYDFSYISMTNPPIPFGGSKWQ